ncbi:MAG TPA: tRNA adenosine(34) deaminase TadA [Nitrospiria bacterium]|nr:tRNA adenosine(34) deaminase TadA [Nitrospiria bacterium]
MKTIDQTMMESALCEAREALVHGDVPIGAVIVRHGAIIARGHNRRECDQDPTAHAELIALRQAAAVLGRWRLSDCTLYVTLEPCAMCAGALVLARVDRLVYGCDDPKAGACGSVMDLTRESRLNHRIDVLRGVSDEECGRLLRDFFSERRLVKL